MANGDIDAFAGLFVGGFLLAAIAQGKSKDLLELGKDAGGFIVWGGALVLLQAALRIPAIAPLEPVIWSMIILGILLNAGPKFFSAIETFKSEF